MSRPEYAIKQALGGNTIYGGAGEDTIYGSIGEDTVYGGRGNDTFYLNAGDANDIIDGGDGTVDIIVLNGSSETFLLDGSHISNIEIIDMDSATDAKNQVKSDNISGSGSQTLVFTDRNNDDGVDGELNLSGLGFSKSADENDVVFDSKAEGPSGTGLTGTFHKYTSGALEICIEDGIDIVGL